MTTNSLSHGELTDHLTLLQAMPYAIQVIHNGVFVFCNKATLNLFDADKTDDLIGKPFSLISPDTQQNGVSSSKKSDEYFSQALTGEKVTFDWTLQTLQSRLFAGEVTVQKIE